MNGTRVGFGAALWGAIVLAVMNFLIGMLL